MKIAVIGAGIIGVTTAYELARDGHEVNVIERHGAVAEEASFANAGVIAPGYVAPWAAPGMPARVFWHLFSQHAPVKVGFPLSPQALNWMWRWYRACRLDRYLTGRSHMQSLAFYSRDRLHLISDDLKLNYERSNGYMVLLRSHHDHKFVQPGLQLMRDVGVTFKETSPAETRLIEPGLNPDHNFFGAIHLPDDEVGNCRQFALMLKNEAQRMGVQYSFNATVTTLECGSGVSLRFKGDQPPQRYDNVVVCAGSDSAPLLRRLGLRIPLVAVHGYSISTNIREPLNAPISAVMDERYKVAISRLGQRIRVSGSAELGGTGSRMRTSSVRTLYKVLHDWFPGAANLSSGLQAWKGARAMPPEGPPLLGASGLPGIWLNLGHGSSGWTLSCGSARVLADLIGQRKPDIDATHFDIKRLRA